ncbi:hypothetical protein EG835_00365, partial [bacterium]|nr:hypothetical protein [bacterium]
MGKTIVRVLGVSLLGLALVASAGCVRVELEDGGYERADESVDAGGANEVNASIDMGVGELSVSGGASNLMNAEFEYSHSSWEPEIEYEVSDGTGELAVQMPRNVTGFSARNTRYV